MSQTISRQFNSGDSCTISATPVEHYHFVAWFENNVEITKSNPYTFSVAGNRTIEGRFAIDTHLVSASVSPSGSGTISGAGSYNYGASCSLTFTPSAGYTFSEWQDGNGNRLSTSNPYTFTLERDMTVVAVSTLNSHTVSTSVNPLGGGTVSGGGSYSYGQTCTLTATPAAGYNFTSWSVGGAEVSSQNPYSFTVSGNVSVVANFALGSHTITATNSPSNGGIITGTGSYNYGASCTLTATPNTGYHFVNWDTAGGDFVSNDNPYTFTVKGDASFQALYAINSYTISASVDPAGGGTVSGAGNYNHGASVSLTATPNSGYAFVGWYDSGGSSKISNDNPLTFTATQNRTLVAKFTPVYTVEVEYDNTQGSCSFVEIQQEEP